MPLSKKPSTAGVSPSADEPPRFSQDADSACSTPFVSAPSSPGHVPSGYFFSTPASPMHYVLSSEKFNPSSPVFLSSDSGSFEFEFSSRFSPGGRGSMISADELFFNGQIRPQENLTPLADVYGRDLRPRGAKYSHRKARSVSPLRTAAEYEWPSPRAAAAATDIDLAKENDSTETTPSSSASSSRSSSSSSGRNSKKWMFLKDLLHSRGSAAKEKKTKPSLSPSSEKKKAWGVPDAGKPSNGVWKRRVPASAHELLYTTNRAQAEEMKKKTFLPYRQGLLGCLGFGSKSYSAFTGFTRDLINPISST